jgi:hypothetical protein
MALVSSMHVFQRLRLSNSVYVLPQNDSISVLL